MRRLVAYFTITCLTIASSTPLDAQNKVYDRNFDLSKTDVIYSALPYFFKDELVYAVCEIKGTDKEKKCKVYHESTESKKKSTQSCDLNLSYTGLNYQRNPGVRLVNAGHKKAIFLIQDKEVKLINVNLNSCIVKGATIDMDRWSSNAFFNAIIPHEDNYDVIFRNSKLCGDFQCKATYDYEGNIVKAPSPFGVEDAGGTFLDIQSANKGYLVSKTPHLENVEIYLVGDKALDKKTLFEHRRNGNVFLSTAENKIGYCILTNKLVCKQYDIEGKTKKVQAEMKFSDWEGLDVLNAKEGFLVATKTFVTHIDEQGKQGKTVNIDLKCDQEDYVATKLYKNSTGEHCISGLCYRTKDKDKFSSFSTTGRCFNNAELI